MQTFRQRLHGLSIASSFPLPGAGPACGFAGPPDLTLSWQLPSAWVAEDWRITQPSPGGSRAAIGAAADGRVCLDWGEELRCVISPGRDQVVFLSRAEDLAIAPTVVLGLVLGFVLHLRGRTCLHGTVLERHGKASAILGPSGAGKSTLASALVQRGATLISDDLAALTGTDGTICVEPGLASVRLVQDAADRLFGPGDPIAPLPYVNKLSWDVSGHAGRQDPDYPARAVPLARIYVLRDGLGEPAALGQDLPREEALGHLVANLYPPRMLSLLDGARLRDLAEITARVPVRLVRYTRTWEQLERLLELMEL